MISTATTSASIIAGHDSDSGRAAGNLRAALATLDLITAENRAPDAATDLDGIAALIEEALAEIGGEDGLFAEAEAEHAELIKEVVADLKGLES
ncbi:MAG: hypothetical protein ACHQF3_00060 [Alphaproteobacteria bacterium]